MKVNHKQTLITTEMEAQGDELTEGGWGLAGRGKDGINSKGDRRRLLEKLGNF